MPADPQDATAHVKYTRRELEALGHYFQFAREVGASRPIALGAVGLSSLWHETIGKVSAETERHIMDKHAQVLSALDEELR